MAANQKKIENVIKSVPSLYYDFEISDMALKKSDFTNAKYKRLSLDIMDGVRSGGDITTMSIVSGIVRNTIIEEKDWVGKVLAFGREHFDIQQLLICKNSNVKDIVMVVDDTTEERILDYNDFLFEIRKEYDEVHDFMVIDENMLDALASMYCERISFYER